MKIGEIYLTDKDIDGAWLVLEIKDGLCTKCQCLQKTYTYEINHIATHSIGYTFDGFRLASPKEAAIFKLNAL